MRRQILGVLACPSCAGRLRVSRTDTQAAVEQGELECDSCDARFAVSDGIARFANAGTEGLDATRRTRRAYNFTWTRFGEREVRDSWEKDSYVYTALLPPGLLGGPGKRGLDAGCGGGADLVRVAETGAEVVGFDLSDGVEVARRLTRHLGNVDLVQGDLHALPFRLASFDFIYSFGVLHHLPEPQTAFTRLAALLKPGAPLITYLYEDRAERSAIDGLLLSGVRAVRCITSRLPPRALHAACCAMVPVVWLTCAAPAAILERISPGLGRRLPFSHSVRPAVLVADLYDRFAPPVEWRFSQGQVRQLYQRAGLERVESRQYRGWLSWGFKPAGVT